MQVIHLYEAELFATFRSRIACDPKKAPDGSAPSPPLHASVGSRYASPLGLQIGAPSDKRRASFKSSMSSPSLPQSMPFQVSRYTRVRRSALGCYYRGAPALGHPFGNSEYRDVDDLRPREALSCGYLLEMAVVLESCVS